MHARAATSGLQGHPNAGQAISTGPVAALPPPMAIEEGLATTHGPGGPSRYHPQAGASNRTACTRSAMARPSGWRPQKSTCPT